MGLRDRTVAALGTSTGRQSPDLLHTQHVRNSAWGVEPCSRAEGMLICLHMLRWTGFQGLGNLTDLELFYNRCVTQATFFSI